MKFATRTEAIILKVIDHGESDKIVTFCSPLFGKQTCIAKYAKKSLKRFVNKLELFSYLELSFVPNKSGLGWIDQADLISPFGNRWIESPGPGGILALEPRCQTIQPREQDPLGNVGLVQLVADFPFEFPGDDDPPVQLRMIRQPSVQLRGGPGHD